MEHSMHIHILGICGTFMGGVAMLAKEKGFRVTGSDANVYPPMSLQLASAGIELIEGYEASQLDLNPDIVIVGNALSRGKQPVVEEMLNRNMKYISGPQWIAENILYNRHVIAIAGTHGKTTTSGMIAWILEYAGLKPGFLLGGVPQNFGFSARLGKSKYFVIEADEYDSAFFDKRSKFIHYHPRTLVLNNLEFDHADIFENLNAIKIQFEYLMRTVPGNGLIVKNNEDKNLTEVLQKSCYTKITTFGNQESDWTIGESNPEASQFEIKYQHKSQGEINWFLVGKHNQYNALAAISAAHHIDIPVQISIQALNNFKSVKRRLEIIGQKRGIIVYDDFAHHPTAIKTTLAGLRAKVGQANIIVVLECASNTMRMGIHRETLAGSLNSADKILFLRPSKDWGLDEIASQCGDKAKVYDHIQEIIDELVIHTKAGDHIILMSNSGFGGLSEKLLKIL
jgi:UDP-N-acetylmuramate: L-alanyl-gamma-D-glutamyl-meso-diaminopimelate ligase